MSKGAYIGVSTLSNSLGDLEVGSTIKLNVSGAAKDFIVVQQGTPSNLYDASCNGTWLLMKDIYTKKGWGIMRNVYADSGVHSYLNGTFLGALDAHVQSAIKQVKIPYVNGVGNGGTVASGSNGLSTKVFLLSGYELGFTGSDFPKDGACLAYFNGAPEYDDRYKLKYNGTATGWWMRSPWPYDNTSAFCVDANSWWNSYNVGGSYGVRPAFVLPSNLAVSNGTISGAEAGYKDVARKVKKGYIGSPADEPIYEQNPVEIIGGNEDDYFVVTHPLSSGNGFTAGNSFAGTEGEFSSVKSSGATASATSKTQWVAKTDIANFSFDYVAGKKATFGDLEFYVTVAGEKVANSSTDEETGSWSGAIKEGDAVVFYSKNGSTVPSKIYNIVASLNVQIGTIPSGTARRVKKAYIGVDGVARLCWEADKFNYEKSETTSDVRVVYQGNTSTAETVYYASDFEFDAATGEFSLTNPSTQTVSYSKYSNAATLVSKYFIVGSASGAKMYQATSSSAAQRNTTTVSGRTMYRVYFTKCYNYTSVEL